jgi:multiple sugar transport system substrate-binding protein
MRFQVPTLPRLLAVLAGLSLFVAACAGASPSPSASGQASAGASSGEVVDIVWYCCLGTGEDAESQLPVEKRIVEEFNASHPNIRLKFEVITYDEARDTLSTRLRGGNPPDIVGPVGVGGAEAFHGEWLDLTPYIEETGFDLSRYEPAAVELYKSGGEGQVGIPFAVYPSILFYRKSAFEEIGLNEPPHVYGEPYVWPDGRESEWNYDTVRELGMLLTVDENGNDATQPGFNPEAVDQYGFEPQRDDPRGLGAYFGPGRVVSDDGTTVTIPPEWEAAWKYWYQGMWDDHFILTGPEYDSDQWAGQLDYAFFTGRVAMHTNFLWSTYGVAEGGDDWDVAAVPGYNGEVTSPLNADTFRIMKDSKHPREAFEVLRYFLEDASADLLEIYAGMPAIPEEQDAFFQTYQEQFPNQVDWQVVKDSLQYADVPNWEGYMPKYNRLLDIMLQYADKWATTSGLDMDAEISALKQELQSQLD